MAKREHSAYFEYFTTQDRKTKVWTWKVNVHRLPASLGPTETATGTASTLEQARETAQKTGNKLLEKHRIK